MNSISKDLLRFKNKRYLGHNPADSVMIFTLFVVLVLIGLSGFMVYGIEEHAGPFAGLVAAGEEEAWEETEDFLEEAHAWLADFAVFLVALHVLGVMVESIIHRKTWCGPCLPDVRERSRFLHRVDGVRPHRAADPCQPVVAPGPAPRIAVIDKTTTRSNRAPGSQQPPEQQQKGGRPGSDGKP